MEGTVTEQGAPIVVKPGSVGLDDLACVLAGAPVVLNPSFWPRVEAAAEIVAKAAQAHAPVYGINTSESSPQSAFLPTRPRCFSATSSSRIAAASGQRRPNRSCG